MATTLTITGKTPTTISATATKTSTTVALFVVGFGTTWEDIADHQVQQVSFGGNQSGTFDLSMSGLSSNTKYGAFAGVIGGGDPEVSTVVDATLPAPAPTVSLKSKTYNTATFSYSTQADGGYYTKTIQYSVDGGGTWGTGATVSSGAATTGTFTVPGLKAGGDYTLAVRSTTTAGSTAGTSVQFSTLPTKKVYGSVSGAAELITDLYGGSNSGAQRITKLYGSVNGQAKLIHQGFGHLMYDYGTVEYYTDSTHSATTIGTLRSQTEIDSLAGAVSSYTTTVDGVSVPNSDIKAVYLNSHVSSIPANFLYHCDNVTDVDISQSSIVNIPNNFVCVSYRTSPSLSISTFPATLRAIGRNFLFTNYKVNQNFSLPSSLTSIGRAFMCDCRNMVGTITCGCPASIVEPDLPVPGFETIAMTSSEAVAYTTGISLTGDYASDWHSTFPDSNSGAYRKTIVV